MKKIALIPFILSMAFASQSQAALTDGVYETTVNGHNAPMTVKVTIKDHKIAAIDTSKNLESFGVGKVALDKTAAAILKDQTIGVDNITGASLSSLALKSAVRTCLQKAGATDQELKNYTRKVSHISSTPVEYKADVAIIGGGGTGLAAAVSAQKAQGIDDSVQKFYEATMKGGHNVGNPELVKYLTENACPTVEWMEKEGVVFRDKIGAATGSLGQRSHYGKKPAGYAYTSVFENKLKEYGDRVVVLTETPASKLIMDKSGRVIGVSGLHAGKQPVTVMAPSVILATGGFGANVKFRQEVNTGVWKEVTLDNRIGTTNINKAAQGDGLKLAKSAHADIIGLSDIQLHPNGTPGTGLMQDIATSGRNRLFINKNGDRFVSESAARDTLCKAIFKQPDGTYWLLMNKLRYPDENKPDRMGVTMKDMLALGRVKKADTLDEMAKLINVPADHLKAAVAEYNKAASNKGTKDKFGFVATNTDDAPMTEGPWYACLKVPTVHHTMGGVRIDTLARALDKDGKPVPGLYAAGEVTGGIHGANRLGGNAIADVFTFGRQAGASAAQQK